MGSDFIIRTRLAKMAKKGTIYDYLTKTIAKHGTESLSVSRPRISEKYDLYFKINNSWPKD